MNLQTIPNTNLPMTTYNIDTMATPLLDISCQTQRKNGDKTSENRQETQHKHDAPALRVTRPDIVEFETDVLRK